MTTKSKTQVTAADIIAARPAVQKIARFTPVIDARTFSARTGANILLKAESLQRTGSFKVRGASAKLAALGSEGCAQGVVAASAGNHGQGVAAAAQVMGIPCEVFVPTDAALGKIAAARSKGAIVHVNGASVDECIEEAKERARTTGLVFIHPFDDPDVIAGQGTVGLEILEQVPDVARVIVPIGGGGLASGIAIAIKSARPEVEVIGVQAAACAPYAESLRLGEPVPIVPELTIADGIAVKKPGEITLPLLSQWLDGVVTVEEDEIAEAMVLLMERCKLVVEGAGAVGIAALLGEKVQTVKTGPTVAVLSGGNVDVALLAAVSRKHETEVGHRLVLMTRLPDRPGALAGLLSAVAQGKANVMEITHMREGLDLHVRETAVELVLETRGHEHAKEVRAALAHAGYKTRVLH